MSFPRHLQVPPKTTNNVPSDEDALDDPLGVGTMSVAEEAYAVSSPGPAKAASRKLVSLTMIIGLYCAERLTLSLSGFGQDYGEVISAKYEDFTPQASRQGFLQEG